MADQNFTNFTLKTPANTDFLVGYNADGSNEFKTTVSALVSSYATNTALNAASSVLLPTSVYREASGNWQSSYEYVNNNSENWDSVYLQVNELSSSWQGGDLSSYATKTALNAASSVLLPTNVYNAASGSFVTTTALNATSSILLPTSVYRATSGTFLVSDTTTAPTASSISNVILISQTDYNNLPIKFANTLYFIV